jgi:hypothetical protein
VVIDDPEPDRTFGEVRDDVLAMAERAGWPPHADVGFGGLVAWTVAVESAQVHELIALISAMTGPES